MQRKAEIEKIKKEMLEYFDENGLPIWFMITLNVSIFAQILIQCDYLYFLNYDNSDWLLIMYKFHQRKFN